jgi:hypothetical protein
MRSVPTEIFFAQQPMVVFIILSKISFAHAGFSRKQCDHFYHGECSLYCGFSGCDVLLFFDYANPQQK